MIYPNRMDDIFSVKGAVRGPMVRQEGPIAQT